MDQWGRHTDQNCNFNTLPVKRLHESATTLNDRLITSAMIQRVHTTCYLNIYQLHFEAAFIIMCRPACWIKCHLTLWTLEMMDHGKRRYSFFERLVSSTTSAVISTSPISCWHRTDCNCNSFLVCMWLILILQTDRRFKNVGILIANFSILNSTGSRQGTHSMPFLTL